MNKPKKMLPYLMIIVCYYSLPMLMVDTGSAMILLCIVLPVLTLLLSLAYGFWQQESILLYALLTGLLFLPAVWMFMNESALVYPIAYAGVAVCGAGLGRFIRRVKQQV